MSLGYPCVLLKECIYLETKVIRHISDNVESSSNNPDEK